MTRSVQSEQSSQRSRYGDEETASPFMTPPGRKNVGKHQLTTTHDVTTVCKCRLARTSSRHVVSQHCRAKRPIAIWIGTVMTMKRMS